MKKTVLALLIIMLISVPEIYSQQKPFVFGFKAGPTMGWMKPDAQGYKSSGVKAGFTWGFIADFFLMENYGIKTGFDVVFQNGGLKIPATVTNSEESVNGTLDRTYHLKYIQIPLSFKMQTNELGKFRIYGEIGLGTNFLIGAKADDEFTADNGEVIPDEDVDIYDEVTFMKMSLIVGAGVDFDLGGSTRLFAGITFNNGFMNILNGQNTQYPTINNKALANYLALEVGIVF